MNKPELVSAVAEKAKITKKEAVAAIDALFEAIANSLKSGEKVQFVGFGTFDIHTRNARKGHNPQTGEEILIPASVVPSFRTGRPLREALNK